MIFDQKHQKKLRVVFAIFSFFIAISMIMLYMPSLFQ